MVRLAVSRDEQDDTKLFKLLCQESDALIFVQYDVTDVTEKGQPRCFWDDLEGVVGFWSLQMQVRQGLDSRRDRGTTRRSSVCVDMRLSVWSWKALGCDQ